MTVNVKLTPEQEAYAQQCVREGRYDTVDAVIVAAMDLMKTQDAKREAFEAMLDEAVAEADRDGWISAEEALASMDRIIEAAER